MVATSTKNPPATTKPPERPTISRAQILDALKQKEAQRDNLTLEIEGIDLFLETLDSRDALRKEVELLKSDRAAVLADADREKAEAKSKADLAIKNEEARTQKAVAENDKSRRELRQEIDRLEATKRALELKVAELKTSVTREGLDAEEKIKASRKHTEETIKLHQDAIDEKKRERETIEKAHAQYRKTVGL